MKVKCVTKYRDLKLNKVINVGDELEVADARGKILVDAKVCEAIEIPPTTEVDTKPAPKKKATKKKVEG